eukprot:5081474-Heterocapsa_arctica.AAC.1
MHVRCIVYVFLCTTFTSPTCQEGGRQSGLVFPRRRTNQRWGFGAVLSWERPTRGHPDPEHPKKTMWEHPMTSHHIRVGGNRVK